MGLPLSPRGTRFSDAPYVTWDMHQDPFSINGNQKKAEMNMGNTRVVVSVVNLPLPIVVIALVAFQPLDCKTPGTNFPITVPAGRGGRLM